MAPPPPLLLLHFTYLPPAPPRRVVSTILICETFFSTSPPSPASSSLSLLPQILNLSSTNVSGSIPSFLGQLSSLRLLDLSSNSLLGPISFLHPHSNGGSNQMFDFMFVVILGIELVMMNQRLGRTIFYDTHMPNTNSIVVPILIDDGRLTGNNNNHMGLPLSRKRSRNYYQTPNESSTVTYGYPCNNNGGGKPRLSSSWFEQEAVLQMQRQLDCLIAQHTQRLRVELEERAKQQAKALASAIREAFSTKLREKDEEIQRVAKMNWALQERIRNLCVENQLWMGHAQSNEAVANSLRNDLERVLTGTTRKVEEEESCCGSNEVEEEEGRGRCKGCGVWTETAEEGVVVMPCRHVFLMCTRCKLSSRQSCPVCRSSIISTLHVHLPLPPKKIK